MYYIRIGDENRGPFSLEQLRMRGLAPDEFVWCEGMDDWQTASECADLADVIRMERAALPIPNEALKKASQNPPPYEQRYDAPLPKHSRLGIWGFGLGVASVASTILCFAVMVVFVSFLVDLVEIPMENIRPEDIERIPVEDWPPNVIVVAFLTCGLSLVGIVTCLLGLCVSAFALTKPAQVKTLPILGLLLNGGVIAGTAFLVVVSILTAA